MLEQLVVVEPRVARLEVITDGVVLEGEQGLQHRQSQPEPRHQRRVDVGVGRVGNEPAGSDVELAIDAGAQFGVSPGLTNQLIDAARASRLPLLPGVMTPSDVIAARAAGFFALKLFPAQQAGGIGMLKAFGGPFSDVTFCPTGGVTADSAPGYLALPNVACVGGSWLTPQAAVKASEWKKITELAQEASRLRPIAART